ncbi:uncharacterized protein N7496_005229 [Penicillium cataractarum]|uniref:NACHT domain-containing protein n=1 Tax=Penicillium cataractarum TaxID=2100454 RepID=A0A9W9SGW8_9EURO|nr:uncharacterized protein N7496_005229 [Penicillium cataractarum]KAJ5377820.1 hypothetical protein N7496_005229 [Penicillium cataractarum]
MARPLQDRTVNRSSASFDGSNNSGLQVGQNNGTIHTHHYHQTDDSKAENRNCIRALHATDPRLDKARIESTKGGLLEDAYNWVLDNDEFKRWCHEQESQLLWVKGDPGKGKTMLMCGGINELSKSAPVSEITVVYFFCQAGNDRINHGTAVLRGLIFMFVEKHPGLISHVRREYDTAEAQAFEGPNTWEALLRTTYLIIDALDECTLELGRPLDVIVDQSCLYPNVKWLVSSRNRPSIEQALETAPRKARLWLEINEASISNAVASFIHFKVEILKSKKKNFSDDIRDAVSQHLLANAQGTFLWAALVCEELANYKVLTRYIRKKLVEYPPGLDPLYHGMLKQIGDSDDAELCRSILGIITTVYRPITLEELSSCIEMPEDVELCDLEEILGLCGSFLTLRGSTISLVHQSAKDFLRRKAVHEIFPRGEEFVHYSIFSRSLDAMAETLRRDIYNLVFPGYHSDLLASGSEDCMIKIWNARNGQCLRSLEGHLYKVCAITLSHDSQLLASSSYDHTSKIWELKSGKCLQTLDHQFPVRTVALSLNSRILASSCRLHKPGSFGSRDHTIKLWDTSRWKCLQTLNGHTKSVEIWDTSSRQKPHEFDNNVGESELYLSHDSTLLASAPDPLLSTGLIKIWDVQNQKCILNINIQEPIRSLIFSRNLKLIATYSNKKMVRVWDVRSGECRQDFSSSQDVKEFFLANPDFELFDGTAASSTFPVDELPTFSSTDDSFTRGFRVDPRCEYIAWNHEEVLWLPPEY